MKALLHNNKHSVVYGRKTIDFSLLYCGRKTMEIARWILRQLNYFKQFNPKTPDRCYVNGETHLYLGKQYRLKLAEGTENSVKLSRGFFHIACRNEPTPKAAKKLLNQWYFEKAQLQFAASMDRCRQKFNGLGIKQPKLSIKRMQKRWGSLSDKGTVTLNTDLVRAPKECIDYVVTHELVSPEIS